MATILPDRNLIVPVIRNADSFNLKGLAETVNDLSGRARKSELSPDEISGGTFTFTNIGIFGTLTGTPLVNLPESAILSIGAIIKKPLAVLIKGNYTIGIRDAVMLSLSYDHRVIDGGLGGLFLKSVADYLTNFDIKRSI
jgi:2-oxoglutarate dehydrogenase E2 component (dihydrolipoamide succinyltransferase)